MSWCNYIVDHENKVLLSIAKCREEDFLQYIKNFDSLVNFARDDCDNDSILLKKVSQIGVEEMGRIASSILNVQRLAEIAESAAVLAVVYVWQLEDQTKIEFISEDKADELEKKKKYKYLN